MLRMLPGDIGSHCNALVGGVVASSFTVSMGECVVLLLDAKGYTALSEKYARVPSILSDELNKVMSAMVDAVYANGGYIERFAGDACIAIFGSATGAMRTGSSVCSMFSGKTVPVTAGAAMVSVHGSLSHGSVTAHYVGGFDGKWHRLLTGDVFRRLEELLSGAAEGEMVVDPQLAREPDVSKTDAPAVGGAANAPVSQDLSAAAAAQFLDDRVIKFVQAGSESSLASVRVVSSLFIALPSTGGDLQQSVAVLQERMKKYGGFLGNILTDEKGTSALVIFGWPVSHGDDALRACRMALEIRSLIPSSKQGIARGRVFCGFVGNKAYRRDVATLGSAINISARLMGKAEASGIFCCNSITSVCRHDVGFSESFGLLVKGRDTPVVTSKLLSGTPAPSAGGGSSDGGRSSTLPQRSIVMQFYPTFASFLAHGGNKVVVAPEHAQAPLLVESLLRQAPADSAGSVATFVRVVRYRCLDFDVDTPFSAVAGLLDAVMGFSAVVPEQRREIAVSYLLSDPDASQQKLRADAGLEMYVDLLSPVIGFPYNVSAGTAAVSADSSAGSSADLVALPLKKQLALIGSLVSKILGRIAATSSVVYLLERADQADTASKSILASLRNSDFSLVVTVKDETSVKLLGASVLVVPSLSDSEAIDAAAACLAQMSAQVAHPSPAVTVGSRLRQLIVEQGRGSVSCIVELLAGLQEGKLLQGLQLSPTPDQASKMPEGEDRQAPGSAVSSPSAPTTASAEDTEVDISSSATDDAIGKALALSQNGVSLVLDSLLPSQLQVAKFASAMGMRIPMPLMADVCPFTFSTDDFSQQVFRIEDSDAVFLNRDLLVACQASVLPQEFMSWNRLLFDHWRLELLSYDMMALPLLSLHGYCSIWHPSLEGHPELVVDTGTHFQEVAANICKYIETMLLVGGMLLDASLWFERLVEICGASSSVETTRYRVIGLVGGAECLLYMGNREDLPRAASLFTQALALMDTVRSSDPSFANANAYACHYGLWQVAFKTGTNSLLPPGLTLDSLPELLCSEDCNVHSLRAAAVTALRLGKFATVLALVERALSIPVECDPDFSPRNCLRFGSVDSRAQLFLLGGRLGWLRGNISNGEQLHYRGVQSSSDQKALISQNLLLACHTAALKRDVVNLASLTAQGITVLQVCPRHLRFYKSHFEFFAAWCQLRQTGGDADNVHQSLSQVADRLPNPDHIISVLLIEAMLDADKEDTSMFDACKDAIATCENAQRDLLPELYRLFAKLVARKISSIPEDRSLEIFDLEQQVEEYCYRGTYLARSEEAILLELRCTVELARFWVDARHKNQKLAFKLLADLLDRLVEVTPEIQEAKILLDHCAVCSAEDKKNYLTLKEYLQEKNREIVPIFSQKLGIDPEQLRNMMTTMQTEYEQLDFSNSGPLKIGDTAPAFSTTSVSGAAVDLSSLLQKGPVVVNFQRGSFCFHCNAQVELYTTALPAMEAYGAHLISITPGGGHAFYERFHPRFFIVQDQGRAIALNYGVVFDMPPQTRAIYEIANLRPDLEYGTEGDWRTSIPATFIIGQDGTIVNCEWHKRPDIRMNIEDVLETLKRLHEERERKLRLEAAQGDDILAAANDSDMETEEPSR